MYLQKTYEKCVSVTLYLGIVLCEVIGRVDPDPDYLPRTTSFGLAVAQYYVQFALKTKCPQYFFAIAVIVSTHEFHNLKPKPFLGQTDSRVVYTQADLFLKSMSERSGSDIQRL